MRTFLLVGGLAAGIIYYVYEWYTNRENQNMESPYGSGVNRSYSNEEFVIINETKPKTLKSRGLPSKEDICVICLDPFFMQERDGRGYGIIALPKCKHWFHHKCAIRLIEYHPECPVCREPIDSAALRGTPVRVIEIAEEGPGTGASTSIVTKKND